jgi:HSP20 family protein
MRELVEAMDRMALEPAGGRRAATSGGLERSQAGVGSILYIPQVEIFERDKQLVVRADLPGIPKEDIRVEITDDALVIEGERRDEREETEGKVYRSERVYGAFRRMIPLPEGVDVENAKSTFRNGVLEVVIPAQQMQSRRRQLEINDQASESSATAQQPQAKSQKQSGSAGS